MGCGCVGPSKDKYSIENILNEKIQEPKEITSNLPISEYVKKAFCLINKVRLNPSEFVTAIEQAEKYIKEINGRKIFDDNKIKVSLNEGKKMFQDCADYLRNLQPMEELNFCDEIVLECPKDEKNIRDINHFKEKLLEKKSKFGIEAYFKDSIRVPEISVLLMLVDDSTRNPKKKRETLLNPKYKFIGISSSDNILGKEENQNNDNLNDNNIKEGTNNTDKILKNKLNKPFCAYFTLK
jgi:hypothetical protein